MIRLGPHVPGCRNDGTPKNRINPCLCRMLARYDAEWFEAVGYEGSDARRTELADLIRLIARTEGRIEYLEAWEARTGRQRGEYGEEVADLAAKNAGRILHACTLLRKTQGGDA